MHRGWRVGSAVKSTHCSWRRPGFGSNIYMCWPTTTCNPSSNKIQWLLPTLSLSLSLSLPLSHHAHIQRDQGGGRERAFLKNQSTSNALSLAEMFLFCFVLFCVSVIKYPGQNQFRGGRCFFGFVIPCRC